MKMGVEQVSVKCQLGVFFPLFCDLFGNRFLLVERIFAALQRKILSSNL